MKQRLLAFLVCAACGGLANAHGTDAIAEAADGPAATDRLPKQELSPQLLHQFLVAEFAGHRGQFGLAVSAYRDLAKATRDPRVARRATEIALHARQYDAALETTRLWVELDDASPQASQTFASLLAATGRIDELAVQVSKMLATAGPDLGSMLLRLNRVFARSPDKRAVQKLIGGVTEPYLGIAEAHFARAIAAFEAQDLSMARHEIERALSLRPNWEQAAIVRAQVMPRGPEMIEGLRSFVADNPAAREARLAYARALVGEKRYEEARREFVVILKEHPDNPDVIYAVAVLSLQLNDAGLAEGHLKRLVEMGYAEADSARLYLGQIAEEKQQWDDALQWYAQVRSGEQFMAAQMRMAGILARTGRIEEARRQLQGTRAGNPRERTQLVLGEAQLLREAGRLADAFHVLENGLVIQPNQPELLYEAALMAEKIGRVEVLERNLRLLIQLNPGHAHAHNALGYSLADRGERLDEAQQLIDRALQLQPDDPFILDSKGWLLFRRGDTAAAIAVLKKAYGLRADPEIAAHLGEVLWVTGERDEASRTWAEALKASPANEVLATTIKRFKP
ncbi:MAG: tetratricopeptide repeat protein [Sterolibacteriaceae bacterium MAG5]|nr:tetratricopeptide repeat protein [Candidatus Nitricoxidireducens bremensis]